MIETPHDMEPDRPGAVRKVTGNALAVTFTAGAFAPLAALLAGNPGLVQAGLTVVAAVGGNFLSGALQDSIRVLRHGRNDQSPVTEQEALAVLRERLESVLTDDDQSTEMLAHVAEAVRDLPAVFAKLDAVHSQTIQTDTALRRAVQDVFSSLPGMNASLAEFKARQRLQDTALDALGKDLRELTAGVHVLAGRAGLRTRDSFLVHWYDRCPYAGLEPYDQSRADVYFGRESETLELVEVVQRRLAAPSLVVVTGASGVGKSSLLQAGLLPYLAKGLPERPDTARWPHAVFAPGRHPLTELAARIAAVGDMDSGKVKAMLLTAPEDAYQHVHEALVRNSGAARQDPGRMVIIVDQFEQVFTLARSSDRQAEQEGSAFITALHAMATHPLEGEPAALIVIGIRADYHDRCLNHPELKEVLQNGCCWLSPMRREDFLAAAVIPAKVAGLEVEPALRETIGAEVLDHRLDSGTLPLLSEAMRRTWEKRDGRRLTRLGYVRSGRLARAVEESAEEVYERLPPALQQLTEQVFRRMVVVGDDGKLSARPVPRAEFYLGNTGREAEVEQVLEAFARARLIVLERQSVHVSHEILLQVWSRMTTWFAADRSQHHLYRNLITDTTDWKTNNKETSYLYRGKRLTAVVRSAEQWRSDPRYPKLSTEVKEFIHASTRRRTHQRMLSAAAVTLLMLTVTVLGVRWIEQARHDADVALSDQAAERSITVGDRDPQLSSLLAAGSWRLRQGPRPRTALLSVLSRAGRGVLRGHTHRLTSAAFSPDGTLLVTTSRDSTLRFWDVARRQPIGEPISSPSMLVSARFSPDGTIMATGNQQGLVQLWDPVTRRQIATLGRPTVPVTALDFAPESDLLAVGHRGPDIRLWAVRTRKRINITLSGHGDGVTALCFQPGTHILASGDGDGMIHRWDISHARRRLPHTMMKGGNTPVTTLAFSDDGSVLASANSGGAIRLHHPGTLRPMGTPLPAHQGSRIGAIAFAPVNGLFVSAGLNGTVELWNAHSGQQAAAPLMEHAGAVTTVAFGPAGIFASGGEDGTVRLWQVPAGTEEGRPLTHNGPVQAAIFSPDGKIIATGSASGHIQLWSADTSRPLGPPLRAARGAAINVLAFSPDGRILAGGTSESLIQLWATDTHRPLRPPLVHDPAKMRAVNALAFSLDGRVLLSGGLDGAVRLWRTAVWEPDARSYTTDRGALSSAALNPTGTLAATSEDHGPVVVWDVSGGRKVAELAGGTAATSITFDVTGGILAAAYPDGTIRLWRSPTFEPMNFMIKNKTGSVDSIAFHPREEILISGGNDGQVRFWDGRSGRLISSSVPARGKAISTVAIETDGRQIVTAGVDRTARRWSSLPIIKDLITTVCAEIGDGVIDDVPDLDLGRLTSKDICPP
ncbi:AAA family ATPase [Streptosporangium sp. NPDC048047]|uniref:nSTAND1 domain-containing NTPase n=1 Tax=Streptosporangium sp. NPDC048047 TaxID=3155748 RepID=UPI00343AF97A